MAKRKYISDGKVLIAASGFHKMSRRSLHGNPKERLLSWHGHVHWPNARILLIIVTLQAVLMQRRLHV